MATENVKQRIRDEDPQTETITKNLNDDQSKSKRERRVRLARRGVKTLAIAIALPVSLSIFNIYLFGSSHNYNTLRKPFWSLPPLWLLHTLCLVSCVLIGVSSWLVWAEGGFHRKPMALSLYLMVIGFSLVWDPAVFRFGARWIGLGLGLGLFGSILGCSRVFKEVNQVAGDLLIPCLAWPALISFVNLQLIFLWCVLDDV